MTDQSKAASQQESVELKTSELPAYCPTEKMGLWNSHPRVYIPLEEKKEANCPYCGTHFKLIEE